MEGRVNSVQSMGAVDGPGLRYVVFLQGCPLRCAYCHNPETWELTGGTPYTAEDLCKTILRYRPYFGENGGVTVSGGEPLLQPEFVAELFRRLHEHNIHTALDTAGAGDLSRAKQVLKHTDLVLCDIKFPTEAQYKSTAAAPCSTRSISCALRNRCIFPSGCATSSRPVFPIRLRASAPSKLSRSRSPIWRKSSGCRLKTSAPPNTRRFISRSPWATNPRSHKATSKRSFQIYNFIQKGCPALCRAAFSFSSLFPFWFRFIHFLKNSQF